MGPAAVAVWPCYLWPGWAALGPRLRVGWAARARARTGRSVVRDGSGRALPEPGTEVARARVHPSGAGRGRRERAGDVTPRGDLTEVNAVGDVRGGT